MLEKNTNETYIEKDKEQDTYYMSSSKVLTRSQKLVAAGLAFFAFLTVVFWSHQFKKSVSSPFSHGVQTTDNQDDENSGTLCQSGSCLEEDEASRTKDTDGDGLWDFDEENLYQTSIYLEDSDSDGISDKDEIDNGTDPNCPLGQDCNGNVIQNDNSASQEESNFDLDEISEAEALIILEQLEALNSEEDSVDNVNSDEQAMQDLLDGKASAEALRVMLESAGMDASVLDSISDEDLLEVYGEMIK